MYTLLPSQPSCQPILSITVSSLSVPHNCLPGISFITELWWADQTWLLIVPCSQSPPHTQGSSVVNARFPFKPQPFVSRSASPWMTQATKVTLCAVFATWFVACEGCGLVWWIELTAWFHHDYLSFRWCSASPPHEESATWMKLCPAWQTSFHCDFSPLSFQTREMVPWGAGEMAHGLRILALSEDPTLVPTTHCLLTCPVPGVKCPFLAFASNCMHITVMKHAHM